MVLPALGAFAGKALTGLAAGAGTALVDKLAGGKGSSGERQAAAAQSNPLDFYAKYGAQAAAANNPLTLATSEFGAALQGSTYSQALLAQGLSSGSSTALADAATRGNVGTQLQASEVAQLINKGIGLQEDLGKARLGVALLGPQFMAQAATAARDGDNALAKSLAETNLDILRRQEISKAAIAEQFSEDIGTIATTRAAAQSALAQGAQRIAGQLQLGDQNIMGNLTLNKAKTESELSRIRANTSATKELRSNAVNIALAGQRYFA